MSKFTVLAVEQYLKRTTEKFFNLSAKDGKRWKMEGLKRPGRRNRKFLPLAGDNRVIRPPFRVKPCVRYFLTNFFTK